MLLEGLTERFKQVLECFTYWCTCMSNFLPGYESPTEEEQLRAIWNEVNVGATGFLDRHELSVVCDHIGMDSMNEQVWQTLIFFSLKLGSLYKYGKTFLCDELIFAFFCSGYMLWQNCLANPFCKS